MTFQDFINQWTGVPCDFDGAYGNQCVDLFNQYNQDVLGNDRLYTPTTGGAADLWNDFTGPGNVGFVRIENTPEGVPASGDVIIWAANTPVTGAAGHVGIAVSGCDTNTIYSFDQNYPTDSLPHIQHHSDYTGVLGWLHPLVNDVPAPAPAPQPAPVEVPAPVESTPVVESVQTPITPVVAPVEAPVSPQPDVAPVDVPIVTVTPVGDSTPAVSVPVQTQTQTVPIITDVKVTQVNKLKSRKLWLTVGTWAILVIGALVHYFSSTQTVTALGLVTAIYVVVQGAIDHNQIP